MKNKKIIYVLIPVTLLVWGMIIYKIVSGMYGGNDASGPAAATFIPVENNEIVSDTFSIHPNYRDPFLGKFIKAPVAGDHQPNPNAVKKAVPPPVTSAWPNIVYGGMIRNQKSNKQLVMIFVNGQSAAAKTGDIVSGVEVTKITKDSIEVKFGKEKRFVRK